MKIETIAVHGGYSPDPTTKAVAVPIRPIPTMPNTLPRKRCVGSIWV